jgi:hypothetical protein
MTNIETLTEAYIASKHGWAVAEQFRDTFDGQSFDEQNTIALSHILESVDSILDSDILNESCQEQLQNYVDNLKEYIVSKGR